MRTKKSRKPALTEPLKIRGGIEIMVKNALTGEVVSHDKDENAVLYIGRNWIMNKVASTYTETLWAGIKIGIGSTAANATDTGLKTYYTYRAGTIVSTTQAAGAAAPVLQVKASWESNLLSDTQFSNTDGGIWEFCLANSSGHHTSGTNLCRYASASVITCTTSNQLLVSYNLSF